MKKRVMSLLLVMLMVFALLPAAMAVDEPYVDVEDGGVNITKTLTMQPNGDYSITLESWSTGAKHTETVTDALPTDIVLVLDQSGSMKETIQSDPTEQDKVSSVTYSEVKNGEYYIKVGGQFYRLKTYHESHFFSSDEYYIYYEVGREDVDLAYGYSSSISYTADNIYKASNTTTTKLEALKTAVNSFLSVVADQKDANGNRVDHRIAIVGFASDNTVYNNGYTWENTEIFNGSDDTEYDESNIETAASTALKKTDESGLATLAASVEALSASGGTCSDKGLVLAKKVLDKRSATDKANRGSAVLLFTDGRPGSGSGRNQETYADNAVSAAYNLKHAADYSAYVFTVGVFNEEDSNTLYNNYTIKEYMQSVSSDYPDAMTSAAAQSTTVTPKYYQTAENTAALSEVFRTFAEEISVPTTEVTLDAGSYLSDVINGSDFKVSDLGPATVTAKAVKFSDGSEDAAVTANLKYDKILPASGEVKVSGFDYSTLYHIEGDAEHDGDKLVVTISGLIPTKSGSLKSNSSAGIFEKDGAQVASVELPKSPSTTIAKKANIIDFNAKMILDANITRMNVTRHANGDFALTSGELTYQLKPTEALGDRFGSVIMNGVDTAMTFNGTEWKEHQAIPANNIYFDDDLLSEKVNVGDGSGLNLQIPASTDTNAVATKGERFAFTFTGTAVDVYCTTDKDGGVIQAALYEGNVIDQVQAFEEDNTQKPTAKPISNTAFSMRNYSETERLNVPTVHIAAPNGYGTYTVYIYAMKGSHYELDGLRIYNTMPDQSVYDGSNEANAKFFNLRDYLINDGESVTVNKPEEVLPGSEAPAEQLLGVLFVDDPESVTALRTTASEFGTPVTDDNGNKEWTVVYGSAFEAYKANGPKNEIYLAGPAEGKDGQMITFKIDKANVKANHYWLGLSAPDQDKNAGMVQINGKDYEIKSAVDMYYPITPYDDGTVVVRNTGSVLISVTNLKTTGDVAADVSAETYAHPFAVLSEESLNLMANRGIAPAAEETQPEAENSLQTIIRNLISSFVQQLFSSISRMFGN